MVKKSSLFTLKKNRWSQTFVKSLVNEIFTIVICRRWTRIFTANIFLEVGNHVLLIFYISNNQLLVLLQ